MNSCCFIRHSLIVDCLISEISIMNSMFIPFTRTKNSQHKSHRTFRNLKFIPIALRKSIVQHSRNNKRNEMFLNNLLENLMCLL